MFASLLHTMIGGEPTKMAGPDYKLIYFNRPARGEVSRMIMAYAGFNWEDKQLTSEDFNKNYKQKMPFGQLPVLDVGGKLIAQSHAVERFLAKKAGLMGKTDIEEAKINMIVDGLDDYLIALNKPFAEAYRNPEGFNMEKSRAAALEDLEFRTKQLEGLVEEDGHFVGNKTSLADISATYILGTPEHRLDHHTDWNQYPKLREVRHRVLKHPRIAEYIAKQSLWEPSMK